MKSECINVLHIIKILSLTPFTNAKVERMFSQRVTIETNWRNHLGCALLGSLLKFSEEGQSLKKFNPVPAINRWFTDKVRCLTLSSHKYPGKCRKIK